MRKALLLLLLCLTAAGCALQPRYQRPAVELPAAWRKTAPEAVLDGRWWRLYADPALDRLVEEAQAHNTDLAAAVARVDEARGLLGETGSQRYPSIDATAARGRSLSSAATGTLPPGLPRELSDTRASLDVSYEVDLWGRLKAATRAARADLLATEAARDTVRITLAADVVKGYFALRSLDEQVAAVRRTLELREEALALQKKRYQGGVISDFDYRQLEAEAATTRALLPPLERDREIQQAALAALLGRSPKEIMDGTLARADGAQSALVPAAVPSGLPSQLLLRRPDLVAAEQRLVAAHARVAVARADYFPRITLTGFLGTEAAAVRDLFTGPAGIAGLAAAAAQPVFEGGRLDAGLEVARARERETLAAYRGAIQNAFREVRAALAAQDRARESVLAEQARAQALVSALRLARLRYGNGVGSQLDVIDAERNLLAAQVARYEALRAQRAAVADLFRALGG